MVLLARWASCAILVLVIVSVAMAAQDKGAKTAENKVDKTTEDKTPKSTKAKTKAKVPDPLDEEKDCGDHCTKDGQIDWIALIGKLFEMYQNYNPSKSSGGSPIEDALLSAFKGNAGTAKPKSTRDSHTASESKESSGGTQPDLSAALLGSIMSNLAKAGAPSKKGGAADPVDGLKGIIDGLSALQGKDSAGGSGADSIDFSKLTPLLLQMLPSLLGTKSDSSQLNLLSMLMPLLEGQNEGGELLKTLVSQGLKMFLNSGKPGDDSHGPDLDSLLSLAELFTKDTAKEDTSAPRETTKSKLKTEL